MNSESLRQAVASMSFKSVVLNTMLPAPINVILGTASLLIRRCDVVPMRTGYDPPILAADEPTGNLDSQAARSVLRLFENLVAGGKTILMVTHDSELSRRARRTLVIADGEIVDERVNV